MGTAAQSVMGPAFKVTQQRGQVLPSPLGVDILATVHPASIVRLQDPAERDAALEMFVSDLLSAAAQVGRP